MKSNNQIMLGMLWLASCSGELRAKPQLDCKPGADPGAEVCSDGIIGSCAGGLPQYAVCSDIAACQASWQQAGSYKCSRDNLLADAGPLLYVRGGSNAYLQGVALRVAGDGNGDGALSPGEAGTLSIELRNASDMTTHDVTGALSTAHAGVTINSGSELYFGDIESSASACGSSTPALAGDCSNFSSLIKIRIADSVPFDTIDFDLTATDAESNSVSLTFGLPLTEADR